MAQCANRYFVCGFCDGNARTESREYHCQYPKWRKLRDMFTAVYSNPRNTGSFRWPAYIDCFMCRTKRDSQVHIWNRPASECSCVLFMYKLCKGLQYYRWLLHESVDEWSIFMPCTMNWRGIIRKERSRQSQQPKWLLGNPDVARHCSFQQRLSINFWARIIGNYPVGPRVVVDNFCGI